MLKQNPRPAEPQNLAQETARKIRRDVLHGIFKPGQHLSETALGEALCISRNTLREVFRLLSKEGILYHIPNRGVFVTTPDLVTILDVFKTRRFIECRALAESPLQHPGLQAMRAAVQTADMCNQQQDWLGVGSANILFHSAIISLTDSPRLNALFQQLSIELRLVFGLLEDPEFLHKPFIDHNHTIINLAESGKMRKAAEYLENYLHKAEHTIVNAYTHKTTGKADFTLSAAGNTR